MPVNTKHREYQKVHEKVEKTEAAICGDVWEYVPRLSGQTQSEWEDYVGRAAYYNVADRTLLALIGAMVRKPDLISGVVDDEPNVDEGTFDEWKQRQLKGILSQGRVGLHVDWCEEMNAPKLVGYCFEHIINWFEDFYVIEEWYDAHNADDPFLIDCFQQWRVLQLNEAGFYQVDIWRQDSDKKFYIFDSVTPLVRGKPLDYVPFWFVTPYDNTANVYPPPLFSLADLNIQHFKISVDIQHAAHFLALPQPWIAGNVYTETGKQPSSIHVGKPTFLQLEPNSTIGYLEPTGNGLPFLKDLSDTNEQQMYSAGSRLLQMKSGVESAEALQLRSGSESAVLSTVISAFENGLQNALECYNEWAGSSVVPEVTLNRDFNAATLDPNTLSALLKAYAAGAITLETLLKRLYDGEIVDNVEEELDALEGEQADAELKQQEMLLQQPPVDPNAPANQPPNDQQKTPAGQGSY